MRGLAKLLLCIAVLTTTQAARSAEFVWDKRVPNSTGLYLVGEIVAGDYERFIGAIKMRSPQPFVLYVRSRGGNTLEALKIGRLVRKLNVDVYTPLGSYANPNQASCSEDTQALGMQVPCICASACTLIWFGGVRRVGLEIYVHSLRYDKGMFSSLSPEEAGKMYQRAMQEVHAYLIEMDVNDKYYYMMTSTASADVTRVMTPAGGDVAGWTPGFREWLYAKCGNPPAVDQMAWATCTVQAQNAEEVRAVKRLVLNEQ